ncbi:heparan sulfate 2-O-sulfotransferase pipe-like [Limulus polyphemus]|uniref:Heparan sulfate 2-O-sulfotransferase pipe-like n=1 Tax=Limulus polyphemus TaxID=6850 RepID=A0ABM1C556_LIMPO|nr:heparan sulfate 2-O-sulfotransferase pipe-like [Limulus polyphemus]
MQKKLVHEVMKLKPPFAYDRHVYFTDFSKFGYQNPLYINTMRDPVEKIISRFFYWRSPGLSIFEELKSAGKVHSNKSHWLSKNFEQCVLTHDPECTFITGQPYDLAIPYFCGHEEECMFLNNKAALKLAKRNVLKHYTVVGILEEMNKTLKVLEARIPQFFRGISTLYSIKQKVKNKTSGKKKISEKVKNILRQNLTMEYEFYNFICKRLNDQFNIIKKSS